MGTARQIRQTAAEAARPDLSAPFDTAAAAEINVARMDFVDQFLPSLIESPGLITALDVGCGVGYFSRYLAWRGLRVTGVDARYENIADARWKFPRIEFKQANVEEMSSAEFSTHDLVFCVGLLYHLENPLRAIRNLASMTGKILLIETVVAPHKSQVTVLYQEDESRNQGINYIADLPSETWIVKALYRAGFPFVYRTKGLPSHRDFQSSLFKRRRRTFLIASKCRLESKLLVPAKEPPRTNPYLWDQPVFTLLLKNSSIRTFLKKVRCL